MRGISFHGYFEDFNELEKKNSENYVLSKNKEMGVFGEETVRRGTG